MITPAFQLIVIPDMDLHRWNPFLRNEAEVNVMLRGAPSESLAKSEWAKVHGCDPDFAKGREVSLLDIVQDNQILFVHRPSIYAFFRRSAWYLRSLTNSGSPNPSGIAWVS